jgi:hypothetical protein
MMAKWLFVAMQKLGKSTAVSQLLKINLKSLIWEKK